MEQPRTDDKGEERVPCRAEFDALYDRYKDLVFKYSFYLTRDRGEAEDLFQETWLRVVRNYDGIKAEPEKLKPWLCTIVSNLYKDNLRRKKTRLRFLQKEAYPEAEAGSGETAPGAAAACPGPEKAAENADLAGRLQRAVDGLPERQRRVFLLKEVEGLRQDEISGVLGIPLGTVKSLGFRAVQGLRRKLAEYNDIKRKGSCDVGIVKAI